MIKKDFGSIIANKRKDRKLSQPQLAALLCERGLDVKAHSISKWEKNVNLPNVLQFFALCEILEISALELEGVKSSAVLNCYGSESKLDVKNDIATLSLLPEEGLTENTCETVLIPQEDVRISLTMNGKKYTYSGDHINVEAAKTTEVNLRVNNLGEKITLTGDVTIKPWEEDGNYDFEFETVDISSSEWTVEEAGDMVIDGKD